MNPSRRPGRLRYGLRTLLAATAVVSLVLSLFLNWWTRPYAITGTYSNGVRAWEQWERRTVTGRIQHFKTLRWYRNGQIAFEHDVERARLRVWSPKGQPLSNVQEGQNYMLNDLSQAGGDPLPDEPRPLHSLLSWWNGW
jgi:hypothetical protein